MSLWFNRNKTLLQDGDFKVTPLPHTTVLLILFLKLHSTQGFISSFYKKKKSFRNDYPHGQRPAAVVDRLTEVAVV